MVRGTVGAWGRLALACAAASTWSRIYYTRGVGEWEVLVTDEWLAWYGTVDHESQALIVDAIDRLAEIG